MTLKYGYIGLGNMGAPMAKRLVEWPGGFIVYDVRTEAMTPLAELGASLADDVADVVMNLLRSDARSLPSRVELRPSKPRKG